MVVVVVEEGGGGVAITAGRWCQQMVSAVVLGAVNVWQHSTAVSGRAGCMWGWCLASGGVGGLAQVCFN